MSNVTLDTSEKTVSSIDGGGIRGILPACLLQEIRHVQEKALPLFSILSPAPQRVESSLAGF